MQVITGMEDPELMDDLGKAFIRFHERWLKSHGFKPGDNYGVTEVSGSAQIHCTGPQGLMWFGQATILYTVPRDK